MPSEGIRECPGRSVKLLTVRNCDTKRQSCSARINIHSAVCTVPRSCVEPLFDVTQCDYGLSPKSPCNVTELKLGHGISVHETDSGYARVLIYAVGMLYDI